ncbi:MAG: hypothetical protein ACD_81C00100G0004 [uncultured bacterium]|uniref:Uncharacterized protein n=1 Tax=Candidatus Wolfebacteria bacterium GW2011_GWE2_44_13 TaxID=1619017 RepID=A0A0G1JG25_9BACT|nr:MAG: hypothetical protein ACD_81C00100G0004 [uncultured bacterium]KKT42982.1 MAG: hypothetical protein UW32_C0003G0085 [Candidatus Wolfebacteria bacterium GW2011_GWE2_44_13]
MISITDFKNLLGAYGERLTEEQVRQLYDWEYRMADAIFDQWLERNNTRKAGFNGQLQHNRENEGG